MLSSYFHAHFMLLWLTYISGHYWVYRLLLWSNIHFRYWLAAIMCCYKVVSNLPTHHEHLLSLIFKKLAQFIHFLSSCSFFFCILITLLFLSGLFPLNTASNVSGDITQSSEPYDGCGGILKLHKISCDRQNCLPVCVEHKWAFRVCP